MHRATLAAWITGDPGAFLASCVPAERAELEKERAATSEAEFAARSKCLAGLYGPATQGVRVLGQFQDQPPAIHRLVHAPAGPKTQRPDRFRRNRCLKRLGNLCLRHKQQNTRKTIEIKQQPVIFVETLPRRFQWI